MNIFPTAQPLICRCNFEIKMNLFSVKISAKNVAITFVATVLFGQLPCFRLTAAIPSSFGMFVYKIFTSMVTKNEFSGTLKLFILSTKSLVSLICDGISFTRG